jgi:hypothetical protein
LQGLAGSFHVLLRRRDLALIGLHRLLRQDKIIARDHPRRR